MKLPIRRALALCLACLLAAAHAADVAPVRVPTRLVAPAAAGTAMTLDAVLQPVRQATVTAQVGGNVVALRVQPGERVRRGQPIPEAGRACTRKTQPGMLRRCLAVLTSQSRIAFRARSSLTTCRRQRNIRAARV